MPLFVYRTASGKEEERLYQRPPKTIRIDGEVAERMLTSAVVKFKGNFSSGTRARDKVSQAPPGQAFVEPGTKRDIQRNKAARELAHTKKRHEAIKKTIAQTVRPD